MSAADRSRTPPISCRNRRLLPGLALVLWLTLAQPEKAAALHPPPAFVDSGTNPFGLADVGASSKPSFADLDGDGDLDAFIGSYDSGITRFFENTGTATAPAFAAFVNNPFGLVSPEDGAAPSFADLDGDGDLDAMIGDYDGATRFFENTGTPIAPAFASPVVNPFGLTNVAYGDSTPTFVDLDGDGDLDALIGDNYGETYFFENTGTAINPAFAAAVASPFGLADAGSYSAPSFADLDGDGDLDAFVGGKYGNTTFFENTGTAVAPAFAAAVANPFGLADVGDNSAPSFADLDGDGDLDAFIGNNAGNTRFFENTRPSASPAFTLVEVAELLTYFDAPTFANLDGDGDLDLFFGEAGGDVRFLENVGTAVAPGFLFSPDNPVVNPFGLADVGGDSVPSFADLDGDGDLDAFVGEVGGAVKFFENTHGGSEPEFAAPVDNPFGLTAVASRSAPAFADLDGDGDLDAFLGDAAGVTRLLENTGSAAAPAFAAAVAGPFGLTDVGDDAAPEFADLDGDGDLDAFLGEAGGATYFFDNTGTAVAPAFAAATANPFGLTDVGSNSVPSLADGDGDGDLDAFIGETGGGTFFFENTGTVIAPAFAAAVAGPFGLGDAGDRGAPALADLDHDGDLDAFLGEQNGDVVYFQNLGTATDPTFGAAVNPFGLDGVGASSAPTFADLDGDGDLDAVVGEDAGGSKFFENTGTVAAPAFAAAVDNPFGLADVGSRSVPSFADLDGDGDLDAAIGHDLGNTSFFENTGSVTGPAFAAPTSDPFGLADVGQFSAPGFADLDGDGDLDAFLGRYAGDTAFFENTGTKTGPAFAMASSNPFGLSVAGPYSRPVFADLDGDGDLDAVVGAPGGNSKLFENTTPVPVELTAFAIE